MSLLTDHAFVRGSIQSGPWDQILSNVQSARRKNTLGGGRELLHEPSRWPIFKLQNYSLEFQEEFMQNNLNKLDIFLPEFEARMHHKVSGGNPHAWTTLGNYGTTSMVLYVMAI